MLALVMKNKEISKKLISTSLKKGLILFGLLFEPKAVRITPPLTINNNEIILGCSIILDILNNDVD